MSEREFDLIIFGATGVAGQYALRNTILYNKKRSKKLKFAVAGRNKQKLASLLEDVCKELEEDKDKIGIVEANVEDESSIEAMCKRAKLILNVVGPYILYGEPVVKACIKTRTHHVDISGEPQYCNKIQLDYHKQAEEAGIYLVYSCGFDSIPAEIGTNLLKDKFAPGIVNSVESYIISNTSKVNHGTWDSAINAISRYREVPDLKKKLYKQLYDKPIPENKYRLSKKYLPFKLEDSNSYYIPFWEIDKNSIEKSQLLFLQTRNEIPVQFEEYTSIPFLLAVVPIIIIGLLVVILSQFEFGRQLLFKYPHIFSLGLFTPTGPTREQVDKASFRMLLVGKGWNAKPEDGQSYNYPPNKTHSLLIKGPEVAYQATSMALLQSGVTILEEKDKMPFKGGVLPPGFAFRDTTLVDRLRDNSFTIEFV